MSIRDRVNIEELQEKVKVLEEKVGLIFSNDLTPVEEGHNAIKNLFKPKKNTVKYGKKKA